MELRCDGGCWEGAKHGAIIKYNQPVSSDIHTVCYSAPTLCPIRQSPDLDVPELDSYKPWRHRTQLEMEKTVSSIFSLLQQHRPSFAAARISLEFPNLLTKTNANIVVTFQNNRELILLVSSTFSLLFFLLFSLSVLGQTPHVAFLPAFVHQATTGTLFPPGLFVRHPTLKAAGTV